MQRITRSDSFNEDHGHVPHQAFLSHAFDRARAADAMHKNRQAAGTLEQKLSGRAPDAERRARNSGTKHALERHLRSRPGRRTLQHRGVITHHQKKGKLSHKLIGAAHSLERSLNKPVPIISPDQ